MNFKYFISFLLLVVLIACDSTSNGNAVIDIDKEILALSNDSLQSNYLDTIYFADEKARKYASSVLQLKGYNSEEYKVAKEALSILHTDHLAKIERYLEVYNYPSRWMHSREARLAPHHIIHHSPTVETREKNFEIFKAAYEKGDIRGPEFAIYLDKWYQMKNGSSLVIKNPFKEEFEIDTLLYSLGLKKSMEVVR